MSSQIRKYELKARAEKQAETRRRIVEATLSLHEDVGPARTTATRAGQAGAPAPRAATAVSGPIELGVLYAVNDGAEQAGVNNGNSFTLNQVADVPTVDTGLGFHAAVIETAALTPGSWIDFTWRWQDSGEWAGRDWRVEVTAAPQPTASSAPPQPASRAAK